MSNQPKGFNQLKKAASKVERRDIVEDETPKKTDWKKIVYLILKILEPEIRKLPKYYVIIPLFILWALGYGIYLNIVYLIELIKYLIH